MKLIVATGNNGQIGLNGKMPWNYPEDLEFFKWETIGSVVVMGRKTFESIGKPLIGRDNVVITRDKEWKADGVSVVHSIDDVVEIAKEREVYIIGGAEVYKQFLPYVSEMIVSRVNYDGEADTFFDVKKCGHFQRVSRGEVLSDNVVVQRWGCF